MRARSKTGIKIMTETNRPTVAPVVFFAEEMPGGWSPTILYGFARRIHADGPHIGVWVNGYQVSDWTDRRKPNKNPRRGLRLAPGTIQIQGHDPTTDISFRNIPNFRTARPLRQTGRFKMSFIGVCKSSELVYLSFSPQNRAPRWEPLVN